VTSAPFDPDNIPAIREALAQRLSARVGPVSVKEGPARFRSGLDTFVYAIGLSGQLAPEWPESLVLRIFPSMDQVEKAEREFAVQAFLATLGYPAPRPLYFDVTGEPFGLPFMIMARVPGVPAINQFKNPLNTSSLIARMAALQARLHTLPTAGCPLPYESPLVERMLEPSRDLVGRYHPPGLDKPLQWLERNVSVVRDEEPVLTHNDFHPLNLIVEGDQMTVLDWPGAALGDRHCDVGRTLALFSFAPDFERSLAARMALRVFRGTIIRRYKRAYCAILRLEGERLRYWEALHAFTAWTQIATMAQEGEAAIGARPGALSEIPPGLETSLKRYFEERAA
jgi:aminoglycoside phosphotransferase (APT) family kinase protein